MTGFLKTQEKNTRTAYY